MKKPIHEKKKTRPYWLAGFKTGIDLAFLLYGLSSGAAQSLFTAKPMLKIRGIVLQRLRSRQGYLVDLTEIDERERCL